MRKEEYTTVERLSDRTDGQQVCGEARDIQDILQRKGRGGMGQARSKDGIRSTIGNTDIRDGGFRTIGGKDGWGTGHVGGFP